MYLGGDSMKYLKCYPDFKLKAVTFSFDDGTFQDYEMVNMLNHFNMKGTFNVNSKLMYKNSYFTMCGWIKNYRLEKHQVIDLFKGHEIASHTSTHTDFNNLNDDLLKREIDDDIFTLSRLAKYKIEGFAYPFGIYNDIIIQRLKDNGIVYARSTKSQYNFNLPKDFYTYGGTCTISCKKFPILVNKWLKLTPKTMKLFYIWGHSYELDMYHEHEKTFDLYGKIANKEDTWYATNIDIFNYLNAFKKLKFYKDRNMFINNSDHDLYVKIDEQNIIIKKNSKLIIK